MIYHFADPLAWEKALDSGYYKPSSLKTDGFIHCCFENQLADVARRHFPGQSDLLTLHIVERRIRPIYKEDYVQAVGQTFPHIYGPLSILAVHDVSIFRPED
jgi:uncharacterized protein (DUF952 family)